MISSSVVGGIEFEFASDVDHDEFADLLSQFVNKSKINVDSSYVPSTQDKDYTKWSVESDSSIPTDTEHKHKIELVAPIMPVSELIEIFPTIFKLIKKHGKTSENTGLHMTMSVNGKNLSRDLDVVKFMILLDEQYYGEEFGRQNQTDYAKAQIPNLIAKIKNDNSFGTMRETVERLIKRPFRISDNLFEVSKKNAVNFSKPGMIEFRLPGGIGYENKQDLTRRAIVSMAEALADACDPTARLREYVGRLIRIIEDARPSAPDALQNKKNKAKCVWLVKRHNGGNQYTLCDVSDGPVQKTKEWAASHFVIKLVTKANEGVDELLGAGDGSGWNEELVKNMTGQVGDRRLSRLKEHLARSEYAKKRRIFKIKSKIKQNVSEFFDQSRVPSQYYDAIVKKLLDPKIALPANHLSRGYLGIDITPELAKRLLRNESMIPYLTWYYVDSVLRRRSAEIPPELLYVAVRQKNVSVEDLGELAISYVVSNTAIPRVIFYRAVRDNVVAPFVKIVYAGMKHYKVDLDSNQAKAFISYGTQLAKFPSKQKSLIASYNESYLKPSSAKVQSTWTPKIK